MIEIVRPEPGDKTWDRFVEQHPDATIAHLSAWSAIVHDAYGHQSLSLAAVDDGDIVGVLPLVLMKSRLFGRRLVSMPFLDYGGVLAEHGSAAERALADAALALAREHGVASIGLRQRGVTGLDVTPTDDRVTMLMPLASEEAVWKALPSERRNRVRKGHKNALVAIWGGSELLDDFYRVWSVNMRDLGSPAHSRAFFARMLEELGGSARVLLVRDSAHRTVGAAMCLLFRDAILVPWVSSLREAFALCPNFVLYWEAIAFGCREGYRMFDFGRSFRDRGTYEFKRQWGAVADPLPWVFLDVVAGAPPAVDRDASSWGRLVEAWKRLPVPVANFVGPWIRGQVPN